MNLNRNEISVLEYLCEEDEDYFWGFAAIGECVRLDRKEIRRACRSLARKGFTEFRAGLWNEDGGPAGSGYRATRDGRAAMTQSTEQR